MADNIAVTPGTGATVATDDVGGVQFQKVKLDIGGDGVSSPVTSLALETGGNLATIAGDTTSLDGKVTACNTGDVTVGSSALPTGAATAAKQGIGGIDLVGGAGAVAAGVQRVTLASDDPAVAKLGTIDTDTGSIATDASTIAGDTTSIDGKIPALGQALAAASVPVVMPAADISTLTPQTDALTDTELRATPVPVSGSVTVDMGANNDVTVTSGAITETNSGAIKTAVETIDNAISGTEMQVDVVAALPAGTNNIGDVDLASAIPAGTNEIGSLAPSKSPTTDDTAFVKKYYTSAGAVTDGVVWSPAAGKRWYVTDMIVNTSAAATVTFEDDLTAGDSVVMKMELAANGGFCKRFSTPLASGEDAADLLITTSAGNVYVTLTGYEV